MRIHVSRSSGAIKCSARRAVSKLDVFMDYGLKIAIVDALIALFLLREPPRSAKTSYHTAGHLEVAV
jgi:hypothetical protein